MPAVFQKLLPGFTTFQQGATPFGEVFTKADFNAFRKRYTLQRGLAKDFQLPGFDNRCIEAIMQYLFSLNKTKTTPEVQDLTVYLPADKLPTLVMDISADDIHQHQVRNIAVRAATSETPTTLFLIGWQCGAISPYLLGFKTMNAKAEHKKHHFSKREETSHLLPTTSILLTCLLTH